MEANQESDGQSTPTAPKSTPASAKKAKPKKKPTTSRVHVHPATIPVFKRELLDVGYPNALGNLPPYDTALKKPLHIGNSKLELDVMLLLGMGAFQMATGNGTQTAHNLNAEMNRCFYGLGSRTLPVLKLFFQGAQGYARLFEVRKPVDSAVAEGAGPNTNTYFRPPVYPPLIASGVTIGHSVTETNCDVDMNFCMFTDHKCKGETALLSSLSNKPANKKCGLSVGWVMPISFHGVPFFFFAAFSSFSRIFFSAFFFVVSNQPW
jgi:hypothetical protein